MKLAGLFFISIFAFSSGARILCFYPVPSKSNFIIAQQLMVELAERGHEITMVSPFSVNRRVENFREIVIPFDQKHKQLTQELMNQKEKSNFFTHIGRVIGLMTEASNYTLNHAETKRLMAEEKFDLIVFNFIMTTFQQGLAAHFKCPYVILTTTPPYGAILEMLGQPANPETVPAFSAVTNNVPMNMWDRFTNLGIYVGATLMSKYFEYRNSITYRELFPYPKYPEFDAVKSNVSLILVNSHFTMNAVRPLLPNLIEVGGLQIKEKPDPLPEDIKKFIDGAKDGVILVSLGSNLKSSDLPPEKLAIFVNTFRKLKQRVLWKFEGDNVKDLPPNVMVKQWLPQDDILAHKNTKLFISHCGISSYNEALYHGVPIVGVPIVGDQPMNAKKAFDEGWAEYVVLVDLTQENLDAAIGNVLTNPKYKDNVQRLSNLYRDRPMSALQTAVYWVEYVLRHHGAPHLHYPGADLNIFQKLYVDIFIVIGVFLLAAFYVFRKIYKKFFSKNQKNEEQEKDKKKEN